MFRKFRQLLFAFGISTVGAQPLSWFSDPGKTNRDSQGVEMEADFRFELGVFSEGFEPTAANVVQWSSHWNAADTAGYRVGTRRFNRLHEVQSNSAPFTIGVQAWIMGIRMTPVGTERLLFRRSDWIWPASNPMNPVPLQWNTAQADQVVVGTVDADASPDLMRSEQTRSYGQWRSLELGGEALDAPTDDPDGDGVKNLLEFIFATPPTVGGDLQETSVSTVMVGENTYLQVSVPRSRFQEAEIVVEFSGDLTNWDSGLGKTLVVSENPTFLVVRDLVPLESAGGQRFARLKVVVPTP